MSTCQTTSDEVSIAVLSWINDQLRESVIRSERHRLQHAGWLQNAVTALTVTLFCFCVMVLQNWA